MSACRQRVSRSAVVAAAAGLTLAGYSGTTHSSASAATSTPAASAINFALDQLGKPYSWGATGPNAYDCSGLTSSAYRAAGITIPRVSRDQYRAGPHISRTHWKPGDLVFYAWNTRDASTIHHVAIYMGRGWMLDAPHTGSVVQIEPLHSGLMRYAVRPAGRDSTPLMAVRLSTTGAAVDDLQKRLRSNGYLGVKVDGTYDQATQDAVAAEREQFGLTGDTTVGWSFWRTLVVNGRHRSLP